MKKFVVMPTVAAVLFAAACDSHPTKVGGGVEPSPTGGAPTAITLASGEVGPSASGFGTGDSIAVRVTDNSNKPIAGQVVTFSVVSGGGTVSVATRNTNTDGVARTWWTLGGPGAQTLRATAAALTVDIMANAASCPEITLTVGQVHSLNPADAACTVLNGKAERYLVTIVNPTNSPAASSGFKVRGMGGAASSQVLAGLTTSSVAVAPLSSSFQVAIEESGARGREHAVILEKNMELLQRFSLKTRPALQASNLALSQAMAPTVGDVIPMKLPNITVNQCTSFTPVQARVVYVGTKGIVLEDMANPLKGQVDTLFTRIGQEFDNVVFPILNANFGNPLAMDAQLNNDGKMFMLFSTKVNTMGTGLIAGFVSNGDFVPTAQCPASNFAEVFYARAPTVLGAVTAEPTAIWEFSRSIESTIVHEAKHLTSFATKVAQPGFSGPQPQDAWLEESSAEIAQELLSRVTFSYTAKSNVSFAATIAKEVRPSSGMPMNMFNAFSWLYKYLADPEALSLVGSTGPGDVTFYGSGWAFLRWAIDTYATTEAAFLTAMTRDISHVGVANIETITGKSFQQLLSEYSLAMALDDYPGFTPTDVKYSFPSWNLRTVFEGMSSDFKNLYPNPVALKVRAVEFGQFGVEVGNVRGGGFSVLEVSGTQANRQLLEFKNVNGTAFLTGMRINIVRIH